MRELDDALDQLHHDVRTADVPLDAVRARVLAAAADSATPKRRGGTWWLTRLAPVAAAAAVALVAGVVVVGNGSGQAPVAGSTNELLSAREYLTRAADAITTDQPLGPGRYRYVGVHDWGALHVPSSQVPVVDTGYAYLVEARLETWVPQDVTEKWTNRYTELEGTKWLGGTVPQSEAPLPEPREFEQTEHRGECSYVLGGSSVVMCGGLGELNTQEHYARLSRNPQDVLQWLRDGTKGVVPRGGLASPPFDFAVRMLRTGLVPADLRAAFYRALALIDGVAVTDHNADLDGRVGVAVAVEDAQERRELIIDPATGDFIGERRVAGPQHQYSYIPPGTVTGYSVVTTAVVDGVGQTG